MLRAAQSVRHHRRKRVDPAARSVSPDVRSNDEAAVSISASLDGLRTPDGRYLVVRARLWRATNPDLPVEDRTRWTAILMKARRTIALGQRRGELEVVRKARRQVDRAKRALGERGPVWWSDGAPDYNRRLVRNTPYWDWFEAMAKFADAILALLATRGDGSICPSEAARFAAPAGWRASMEMVRSAGRHLARQGAIEIRQRGRAVDPEAPSRGPLRYARPRRAR